jgi:hypothetical protein
MPRGISSRSLAPVVLMGLLMPLSGAKAQAPANPAGSERLAIAQSGELFVIRRAAQALVSTPAVRLGASVRLDRTLFALPSATTAVATQKGRHDHR